MKTKGVIEKFVLITATSCLLFACSHNSPAPVFELSKNLEFSQPKYSRNQGLNEQDFYIVQAGDTLFSIAWYHATDFQELAEVNQLKNNLIYPGQKLYLNHQNRDGYFDADALIAALQIEVLNKSAKKPKKVKSSTHLPNKKYSKVASLSNKPRPKTTSANRQNLTSDKSLQWIWPTDGNILSRFSAKSNANKGLDIDAKRGQPVRATAPGRVVYEGSGLRGYGNLVIIKHSKNYLSAYAHNDKIHVSENEIVKSGQRIADVGSSGTLRDKLHFEIRYKGKPVDPLNYLPKKNF